MNFFEIAMITGTILLIAFAIQLIIYSKGNLLLNKLLGVVFLIRGSHDLFFLLISLNYHSGLVTIISILPIIMFLAAPAIYIYIRSFIYDQSQLRTFDLVHLIPAFVALINLSPLLLSSQATKLQIIEETLLNNNISSPKGTLWVSINIQYIIRSVIMLVYLGFSWSTLFRAIHKEKRNLVSDKRVYLISFLGIATLLHSISIIVSVYLATTSKSISSFTGSPLILHLLSAIMFLLIIWILRHPLILYGNLKIAVDGLHDHPGESKSEDTKLPTGDLKVSQRVIVPEHQFEFLLNRIENHMLCDKPFLNSEYSIQLLANHLEMPVYHCSYLLNKAALKSFTEYVNYHRIQYLIKIYETTLDQFTIEHQATLGGFKNRSTFYLVFRKETGFTPKQYFDQLDSRR